MSVCQELIEDWLLIHMKFNGLCIITMMKIHSLSSIRACVMMWNAVRRAERDQET
jgi:hypothetical protein